ncbi:hypothetical protein P8452_08654 [Trifolium repens]|nr:hypothetical protein P8452_08654 [Trifolium repens]
MGEWVENPHRESALSNVLPCVVDQITTNKTLIQSNKANKLSPILQVSSTRPSIVLQIRRSTLPCSVDTLCKPPSKGRSVCEAILRADNKNQKSTNLLIKKQATIVLISHHPLLLLDKAFPFLIPNWILIQTQLIIKSVYCEEALF